MQFEHAYDSWQQKRLTQEDAASLLNVCSRTFRRYIDRYEENGMQGLIDKRLIMQHLFCKFRYPSITYSLYSPKVT